VKQFSPGPGAVGKFIERRTKDKRVDPFGSTGTISFASLDLSLKTFDHKG
jgi:hypothetical protein